MVAWSPTAAHNTQQSCAHLTLGTTSGTSRRAVAHGCAACVWVAVAGSCSDAMNCCAAAAASSNAYVVACVICWFPCDVSAGCCCRVCYVCDTCAQCHTLTYPHSCCRCVRCGSIHRHHMGCRRLVTCSQRGEAAAPHASCDCLQCGQHHSNNRGCRVRAVPIAYSAALTRPVHVQPHSIGACDVVCGHCAARSWPGENIRCCARGGGII